MTDLVSVVVPVGRVDADLDTQLSALVAQDAATPFEVVLARNTSAPDEVAALDATVARLDDERFRVVDASSRRGAAHARNAGAAAARGSVLAFCDSDDFVEPSWLGELVGGLEGHDAVCGHTIDVGLTERQARARPPATPDALPTFMGVPYLLSGCLAIGRPLFEEVGGFDEDLHRCEDIALSWKLLGSGFTIGFVPEAVLHYRHRPGLVPMLRQHFHYGRGMAQVLMRYGIPEGEGWDRPSGMGLMRANSQPGGGRSLLGTARRLALGAGRAFGIIEERVRARRSRDRTGLTGAER